jgi:hypothetical protein
MGKRRHFQKDDILSFESSYKQTQYLSALIISICSFALFWELKVEDFNSKSLKIVKIGFICIFVVFCINIYVIHSISNHVSKVYALVSGFNRSEQDDNIQTEEAYNYHVQKYSKMRNIIKLFQISLAILVVAVCIIITNKHSILDHRSSLILITVTSITILGIYRNLK